MTAVLIDPRAGRSTPTDQGWERTPLGLMVPARPRRRYDRPVAVDLFCGGGGFGLGFHQAGWHVAAASEMWMHAALTYMLNLARPGVRIHFDTAERQAEWETHLSASYGLTGKGNNKESRGELAATRLAAGSGWISRQPADHPGCEHFFAYDIRNLTGEIVLDALGLDVGDVGAVFGGPPCQGFSAMGKRNIMDPRNSLVFEFARLVCEIQPQTFVMENVPGMLSMVTPEGMPVVDAFCAAVSGGGWGEYEALRKALGAAGPRARAGLKGAKKTKRSEEERDEAEAGDGGQPDLFDAMGVPA